MSKPKKSHRICITIPVSLYKHISKISKASLQTKSFASLAIEALLEKYGADLKP